MRVLGMIIDAIVALLRGRPMTKAEVESCLAALAAKSDQKLDWQHSVVDLLKLLGLDSSLAARKELAVELGYDGPLDGSAEMNMRLHGLVMEAVARRYI